MDYPFLCCNFALASLLKHAPFWRMKIPISFRYHSEGIQNAFWSYFLTLKRISSWQKSFLLTSSRVFQIIWVVEGLKYFHFVLHSPCTTLLCEVRLRFGRKNENFLIFILFFTHLALTLFDKENIVFYNI